MRTGGTSAQPNGRLLVLIGIGLLPWTVITWAGGTQVVALWGLLNPDTLHVVSLPEYLFVLTAGLPDRLLAWPVSALLYAAGLGSAGLERSDHGDRRLTVGLLALAALAHLGFAAGVAARGSATVLPIGPVLVGAAIWWFDGPFVYRWLARER